jgi:carbon monoxide dehydrogenase subunit G
MLRFEGDRTFARPPGEMWKKLTDARFLAGCIPDVESVTSSGPGEAELVLRPGFAFVRGTLRLTLRVADAVEPESARVLAHGKGIGSSSDVEATLNFKPDGEGTKVHWAAEIKALGGLLKAVPQGLIHGAAEKVVADAWAAVERQLGEPPSPA